MTLFNLGPGGNHSDPPQSSVLDFLTPPPQTTLTLETLRTIKS